MDPNTHSNVYISAAEDAAAAVPAAASGQRPRRRRRKGLIGRFGVRGFDVPYFMLIVMLMSVGLVMLFSASYSAAYYKYANAT